MRTPTFLATLAWLLLGFSVSLVHAVPATPGFPHETTSPFQLPFQLSPINRPAKLAIESRALGIADVPAPSAIESRALGIADIPACGIKCLLQYVPASGCSLTDTVCVCTSAVLNQQLSACMLANCTTEETIGTARVNADVCGLSDESQRNRVIVYTITVYAIALTLVALRIAGKVVSKRLAWNDAPIVAAVLLAAVPIGCVLAMARIGFGEHLWNLADGTFLPILRYFYIAWSTYVAILGLIKLSLIMFYLDVFPARSFKILGWCVFWYITVNTLIIFLLTIFACTPVSAFWNRDLKGKCMAIQMLGYANSISAIIQDVILVVLPLCFIRNLQMQRARKIAVAIMFMIGSFGCITTIIRLRALLIFKISVDPTWDYVPIVIWTELEITAAFACVSLPAIRVLLVKLTPKSFKGWLSEVTHNSSQQTLRFILPRVETSKRESDRDDAWINLSTAEGYEAGSNHKIGFLPSAETRTSQSELMEIRSSLEHENLTIQKEVVTDKSLPQTPVSVRSKFST